MDNPKFTVPVLARLKFIRTMVMQKLGDSKKLTEPETYNYSSEEAEYGPFKKNNRDNSGNKLIFGGAYDPEFSEEEKKIFIKEFNSLTPENYMKWGMLLKNNRLGEYDFSNLEKIESFASENGLNIRGHALIWGKVPGMGYPVDLYEKVLSDLNPRKRMIEIMDNHISIIINRCRGSVSEWDVVNEPFELSGSKFDVNPFYRILGLDYIKQSFWTARSIDPDAILVLNEQFDDYKGTRINRFLDLIDRMLEEHVPLDRIGVQSHILFTKPAIHDLYNFLKQLQERGLQFEITEFDIRIGLFIRSDDPFMVQANYIKDFCQVCRDFPNFRGITFWSQFDSRNWMDNSMPFSLLSPNAPGLFDTLYRKKPAYIAVASSLLNKQ